MKRKISDESLKTPVKHRKSDIINTSVNSDKSSHKKKNPESLSRGWVLLCKNTNFYFLFWIILLLQVCCPTLSTGIKVWVTWTKRHVRKRQKEKKIKRVKTQKTWFIVSLTYVLVLSSCFFFRRSVYEKVKKRDSFSHSLNSSSLVSWFPKLNFFLSNRTVSLIIRFCNTSLNLVIA